MLRSPRHAVMTSALLSLASCGDISGNEPQLQDDSAKSAKIISDGLSIIDDLKERIGRIVNAGDARRLVFLPKKFDAFNARVQSPNDERAFAGGRSIPGEPGETGYMGVLDYLQVLRAANGTDRRTFGHAEVNWQPGQVSVRPDSMMGEVYVHDEMAGKLRYVSWRKFIETCFLSDKMPVPESQIGPEFPSASLEDCKAFQDVVFELIVAISDLRNRMLPVVCMEWGPDDTSGADETVVDCPEDVK